jgi:DNA-binding HxlR family transcriptional regulator
MRADARDAMAEQEHARATASMPVAGHGLPDGAAAISCTRFQHAIEFIGRRWVGAILFVLMDGPCRFNELLAKVPNLSDRLLAERLRELETAGMVTREVHGGPPVKVVYALTDAGRALSGVMTSIAEWAHAWLPQHSGPDSAE